MRRNHHPIDQHEGCGVVWACRAAGGKGIYWLASWNKATVFLNFQLDIPSIPSRMEFRTFEISGFQ
jgi:hypothetical protein